MKKIILAVLASLTILTCFAACSTAPTSESSSGQPTVVDDASFEFVYMEKHDLKGYMVNKLLEDCTEDGVLTIPETHQGEPVFWIGRISGAIDGDDFNAYSYLPTITEIRIPSTAQYIENCAFVGMKDLKKISFPNGNNLRAIDSYAFAGCSSLTTIELPDSLYWVSVTSFFDCPSLTDIKVSSRNPYYSDLDGVLCDKEKESLYYYPSGRREEYYSVPDSIIEIQPYAFWENTTLTSVELNNVEILRIHAFEGATNLSTIESEHLLFMEGDALKDTAWIYGQSASVVTLGNVLVKYQGVAIQYTVTGFSSVAPQAFKGNDTLRGVIIENDVINLGDEAFMDCTRLERVEIRSYSLLFIGQRTFDNNARGRTIYVPAQNIDEYKENELWQPYVADLKGK